MSNHYFYIVQFVLFNERNTAIKKGENYYLKREATSSPCRNKGWIPLIYLLGIDLFVQIILMPYFFVKSRSEIPIQSYKDSMESTIESPDVIPSDNQSKIYFTLKTVINFIISLQIFANINVTFF